METHDFAKKTDAELRNMLHTMEQDTRSMRFQIAGTQLKNVRSVRKNRKDIARIKTLLAERAKVTKATHV